MFEYLFICRSNIGRSQMAEGFFNHLTQGNNSTSAAGVEDVSDKYNHKPHPLITEVMKEKGIDISSQGVKFVDCDLIKNSLKIILLFDKAECSKNLLQLIEKSNFSFISLADPAMFLSLPTDDILVEFRRSRDEVEKLVKDIIQSSHSNFFK